MRASSAPMGMQAPASAVQSSNKVSRSIMDQFFQPIPVSWVVGNFFAVDVEQEPVCAACFLASNSN